MVAENVVTDTHTHTQSKYCNPRCTCAPRVNDDSECSISSDDASVTSEEIMEKVNGELALFIYLQQFVQNPLSAPSQEPIAKCSRVHQCDTTCIHAALVHKLLDDECNGILL